MAEQIEEHKNTSRSEHESSAASSVANTNSTNKSEHESSAASPFGSELRELRDRSEDTNNIAYTFVGRSWMPIGPEDLKKVPKDVVECGIIPTVSGTIIDCIVHEQYTAVREQLNNGGDDSGASGDKYTHFYNGDKPYHSTRCKTVRYAREIDAFVCIDKSGGQVTIATPASCLLITITLTNLTMAQIAAMPGHKYVFCPSQTRHNDGAEWVLVCAKGFDGAAINILGTLAMPMGNWNLQCMSKYLLADRIITQDMDAGRLMIRPLDTDVSTPYEMFDDDLLFTGYHETYVNGVDHLLTMRDITCHYVANGKPIHLVDMLPFTGGYMLQTRSYVYIRQAHKRCGENSVEGPLARTTELLPQKHVSIFRTHMADQEYAKTNIRPEDIPADIFDIHVCDGLIMRFPATMVDRTELANRINTAATIAGSSQMIPLITHQPLKYAGKRDGKFIMWDKNSTYTWAF